MFHTYYLAALAPPLSALAAIGLVQLWALHREAKPDSLLLPVTLAGTALWQAYVGAPLVGWTAAQWDVWLYLASVAAALTASALLLATALPRACGALMAGLAALLAMPAAWSLSVVWVRPNVAAPTADIGAFVRGPAAQSARRSRGMEKRRDKLVSFLRARHTGERYVVAVPNALVAAPIIVDTGLPVMAMGGYLGKDPILGPADLQKLAESGHLRFVMIGGFSLMSAPNPHLQALAQWVRANGTPVDPALWRPPSRAAKTLGAPRQMPLAGGFVTVTMPELYDLRARPGGS